MNGQRVNESEVLERLDELVAQLDRVLALAARVFDGEEGGDDAGRTGE